MTIDRAALQAHLDDCHKGGPGGRWPTRKLSTWHARQHHRYSTDHYHAGANLGPEDRPPGWATGADAIPRKDTL